MQRSEHFHVTSNTLLVRDALDTLMYWVKVVTYAAVIFLCRKRCAVGKSMIYMSFLLDESTVCGIGFSNTLQGHICFRDIFFLR